MSSPSHASSSPHTSPIVTPSPPCTSTSIPESPIPIPASLPVSILTPVHLAPQPAGMVPPSYGGPPPHRGGRLYTNLQYVSNLKTYLSQSNIINFGVLHRVQSRNRLFFKPATSILVNMEEDHGAVLPISHRQTGLHRVQNLAQRGIQPSIQMNLVFPLGVGFLAQLFQLVGLVLLPEESKQEGAEF